MSPTGVEAWGPAQKKRDDHVEARGAFPEAHQGRRTGDASGPGQGCSSGPGPPPRPTLLQGSRYHCVVPTTSAGVFNDKDKHNNTALKLAESKQNSAIITLLGGDPNAMRKGAAD